MTSLQIDKTAAEVFDDACTSFCNTLSEDERKMFKPYPTAGNMLESVKQLIDKHPIHQSRLAKCCKRIEGIASRLVPFFEIIDIFIQTNPQYSGLAWGAIRLVFLIGTNYVTVLDKLSAMIEKMTVSLPAYEDYIDTLYDRARQPEKDRKKYNMSNRLLKALSYIFADILQFCQEACELFSKYGKGVRKKASFISALVWNPFDKRFNDLILRFEDHKKLFELEMNVSSSAEALRFYQIYEENMRNGENSRQEIRPDEQQQEQEDIEMRVRHLKEWISPPLWQESFDRAQAQRTPSTGLWLFQEPAFILWLSNVTKPFMSICQKTLLVKAKPGYGKTILCGLLIDHLLSSRTRSDFDAVSEILAVPSVAFYFFEKQRRRHNLVGDAFRAILTQLIHMYRNNKTVLDIASVIWAKDQSGQTSATANEVSSVLQMLLRQTVPIILVFDGIDECSDADLFFQCIYEITKEASQVSLVFFSRPNIKLPQYLCDGSYHIELKVSQSLSDMTCFLTPKITDLLDTGALGKVRALTAKEIVHKIAIRANGMFLWASLLLEYLQSPALTIREKWDALENLNRLEGLDALCSRILDSLNQRYHGKARTNIKRVFQWVAHSFRPLHIVELNNALNTPFDRAITPEDLIPNFEESLGLISGALLEVSTDRTVRFIHLSIMEFLTGISSQRCDNFNAHGFDLQTNSTHRHLAASCLSYFCHTVPADPLSGSAFITPDAVFQKSKLPFLSYASQFWNRHMTQCLADNSPGDTTKGEDCSWDQLAHLVSSFLYDKSKVTVWIEASWLFCTPPVLDLSGLELNVAELMSSVASNQISQLSRLVADMKELASDLLKLNASWGDVLQNEPNQIWQPSISTFQHSNFWIRVPGSSLRPIGQHTVGKTQSTVLYSQVSMGGSQIGIIKATSSHDSQSVTGPLRYEIWSIESNTVSSAFILDNIICDLHVAYTMSSDLGIVCAGNLLFKFDTCNFERGQKHIDSLEYRFSYQELGPPVTSLPDLEDVEFDQKVCVRPSPKGEYILVISKSSSLESRDFTTWANLWAMEVFRDTDHKVWDKISLDSQNLTHFFPPSGSNMDFIDREIAFHPFLPQIAFSRWNDTCLWDFNASIDSTPFSIYKSPLARVSFTADGSYLFGLEPCSSIRYPESLEAGEYQTEDVLVRLRQSPVLLVEQPPLDISVVKPISPNHNQLLAMNHPDAPMSLYSAPATQSVDCVRFARDHNGVAYLSMLREDGSHGALTRQTLREDGTIVSETLTHLPQDITSKTNATVLTSTTTEPAETVRIVLNKTQVYRAGNDYPLPAILERTKITIPTLAQKARIPSDNVFNPSAYKNLSGRKRLAISDGQHNKKMRRTGGPATNLVTNRDINGATRGSCSSSSKL